jgi:putative glycosyltransferase (TIGR04372 family)
MILYSGHITQSYGRLILFLKGVLVLKTDFHDNKNDMIYRKISRTCWYFDNTKYNFIKNILDDIGIKTSSSVFSFFIYRILSRLDFLTSSTDDIPWDLVDNPNKSYFSLLDRLFEKQLNLIDYHNFKKKKLLNILKDNKKPIVLIHWRTSEYSQNFVDHSEEYIFNESHRDIKNVQDWITIKDYLVGKGFYVIRIGRSEFKTESSESYFDYASFDGRDDFLDLLLWSKAKFAISSSGGADAPRFLFNTPTLILDLGDVPKHVGNKPITRILPKILTRLDGKAFTFSEINTLNLLEVHNNRYYVDHGVYLIENSLQVKIICIDKFLMEMDGLLVDWKILDEAHIYPEWENLS